MTDQDKKQHRVNLQIEIEDADGDLAHLRKKALCLAEQLDEIAGKIRFNVRLLPTGTDFTANGEMATRLAPRYQAALNFDEIGKLIEELRAARQKVFNLSERKAQLSTSGYSMTV